MPLRTSPSASGSVAAANRGGRNMRALVTTLGVVLTLGIVVGGLPAESGAAQATLGCPATAQAGQRFTIEVAIDVGTTPLGAYSIAVTYDPAVLTLASVAGGNTAEFSDKPTTNTPTPGTTNLSAFQSVSLNDEHYHRDHHHIDDDAPAVHHHHRAADHDDHQHDDYDSGTDDHDDLHDHDHDATDHDDVGTSDHNSAADDDHDDLHDHDHDAT